jgi:hypothetical protein
MFISSQRTSYGTIVYVNMYQSSQAASKPQPQRVHSPFVKEIMAMSAANLSGKINASQEDQEEHREFSHRYVKVLSSDFKMAQTFEAAITQEDVVQLSDEQLKMIIRYIRGINSVIEVDPQVLIGINQGLVQARATVSSLAYLKYHMPVAWLQLEKFISFHCLGIKAEASTEDQKEKINREVLKVKEDEPLNFFKVVDPEVENVAIIKSTLKMAGTPSSSGDTSSSFNFISKEVITALIYKAHMSKSTTFKKYHLINLKIDPSNIFKSCDINVSYFTTDRFEASLNISGTVNCEAIKWVKDFNMAGHELIVTLRSWGYLIDWNAIDFNNQKCLFKEVDECMEEDTGVIRPFSPDILEDVNTLKEEDLTCTGGSRSST